MTIGGIGFDSSALLKARQTAAAAGKSALPGEDGSAVPEDGKVRDAAQKFEALLVSQLLKPALQAGGGAGEGADSTMLEMGEEYLAEAISSRGGLGLATLIEKQLSPANGTRGSRSSSGTGAKSQNLGNPEGDVAGRRLPVRAQ